MVNVTYFLFFCFVISLGSHYVAVYEANFAFLSLRELARLIILGLVVVRIQLRALLRFDLYILLGFGFGRRLGITRYLLRW